MRTGTTVAPRQVQRMALTPGVLQSLRLLRMTNRDLTRFLEEQAAENPWLCLDRAVLPPRAATAPPLPARGPDDWAVQPAASLSAHVLGWIAARFPDPRDRDAALCFADALEPSGWLGAPVPELAVRAGVGLAVAEQILARLQAIDPPGLFARDLADCLRLQAADAGLLDPAMQAVLSRLDLLARGDLAVLARATGLPEADVALRLRRIRRLDPKPGARFQHDAVIGPPPDLVVERGGTGWRVSVNQSGLPNVTVLPGAPADDATHAAARRIAAMVGRRNATLLRIAAEIVAQQAGALAEGTGHMRPLRRADVAAALGLNESTVSRALAGLTMATPQGVLPLDAFFPTALTGEVSAETARVAIRRLIAGEGPGRPLTDTRLAALLQAEGIHLARRTVAKYREQLRIPPAPRRRGQ